MKNTTLALLTGLLVLASACGGGSSKLSYGTPQAATFEEQTAANDAQTALSGNLSPSPTTEPTAGGPGLADQLVGTLGGSTPPTASLSPDATARRIVGRAVAMPSAAVTFDPACVTIAETSVTWAACTVSVSETDPVSGDVTDVDARLDGHLSWNAATGVTTWSITEVMAMTLTSGPDVMRINATVGLAGSYTVGPTTIKGHSGSNVSATVNYGGISASEVVSTSLDLDLTFTPDPAFCITGGTLTLEQVYKRRPLGATEADLPDQGWKFEWTGCGVVTVAHGH